MTCKKHKKSDYACQDCFNTIMGGMEEVNRKYKPFQEGWDDSFEK